jgi:hypothetical protein
MWDLLIDPMISHFKRHDPPEKTEEMMSRQVMTVLHRTLHRGNGNRIPCYTMCDDCSSIIQQADVDLMRECIINALLRMRQTGGPALRIRVLVRDKKTSDLKTLEFKNWLHIIHSQSRLKFCMHAEVSMAKEGGFSQDCVAAVKKALSVIKLSYLSSADSEAMNFFDSVVWVEADEAELALDWHSHAA